jgi:hypothetical protein
MKPFILACLLFSSATLSAQKISGFYTGSLFNDTTKLVQQYQLALSEYRGKITGYSYVTFVSNDTFYYGIRKVLARIDGDNLIVADDKFIAHNFPEAPAQGVKRLFVIPLNQQDSVISLSGRWETNRTKKYYSIPGTVEMGRSSDSAGSALFMHLRELELQNAAAAPSKKPSKPAATKKDITVKTKAEAPGIEKIPFDQRAVNLMKTLEVSSDSLYLSFYDNGIIDGDSISVFVNGLRILDNEKLTATALRKAISITGIEQTEIILVAENLGTIPPNTGLLIIRDGENSYQLHFSADLKTNASIIIKRKRK